MAEPPIETPSTPGLETSLAAVRRRLPTCLVVTPRDGRIARFEEYADSRGAEVLFSN